MVEIGESELTEHEAELYDRQIRLWGLESQKRLRSARILICGLNGLGAEVAKNIILAGVKTVTFLDHKEVTEEDSCSQFLTPAASVGRNRAEASLYRARSLNPIVEVKGDTSTLSSKDHKYFGNFDVVVVLEATTKELIRVNSECRDSGVKFFAGDVWGMFGYTFADLQDHEFVEDIVKHKIISKPHEKVKTELVTSTARRHLSFAPINSILEFDYKSPTFAKQIKRTGPAFVLLRILQSFRDKFNRNPSYKIRKEDIKELIAIRDEIAKNLVDDNAFEHVFAQISPVAAIVGGELAQEIIKTVSQKEAPHRNIFLFDPNTCCGFIETIGI